MTDTCKSDHTSITVSLGSDGGGESSSGAGRGATGHPPSPDKDSHHRRKPMSTMLVGSSKASGFDSEAGSARYGPPSGAQQSSARSFRTSRLASNPRERSSPLYAVRPCANVRFSEHYDKTHNLSLQIFHPLHIDAWCYTVVYFVLR